MSNPIPVYVSVEGTVKIAGDTSPRRAGQCAFHYFERGLPVEFFCIGASANQQAMKSMSILREMVSAEAKYAGRFVAFVPMRYQTWAKDQVSQESKAKDCTVWKTYLVSSAS